MSQDEIVFGDVKFREPERLRRPDRDRRWACVAYEVPAPGELPVFLDRETADAIERHALQDTSVELGGILLGKECVDDLTGEPFVWVTKSLQAKHYENTQASFTYTHDSWEEITRERDRLHPDLDIVGWYHTHPDFGVFLSSMDLFIHQNFFAQPLQVAYVVDPIRQTRSFFQWRDGRMEELGGFNLTADRSDRVALARAANDLENLPNPEGSGGALSPRLEAELIAMLSRPSTQHYPTSSADRTLSAALFSLIGAAVGVVALAAVLWLNQLNAHVADQARATADLEKAVRDAADRQRIAFDSVGDVDGQSPQQFLDRYNRAAKARDDARSQLSSQQAINETLGARTKALSEELAFVKAQYDKTKKLALENEKDAKEAADLRPRYAELKATSEKQAKTIEQLEELTDTPDGRKAKEVIGHYQTVWYAAVAGWGLSVVLVASIAGYYLLHVPPDEESPGPPPSVPPIDPNTHRIS